MGRRVTPTQVSEAAMRHKFAPAFIKLIVDVMLPPYASRELVHKLNRAGLDPGDATLHESPVARTMLDAERTRNARRRESQRVAEVEAIEAELARAQEIIRDLLA